jgi:hypothetical protein
MSEIQLNEEMLLAAGKHQYSKRLLGDHTKRLLGSDETLEKNLEHPAFYTELKIDFYQQYPILEQALKNPQVVDFFYKFIFERPQQTPTVEPVVCDYLIMHNHFSRQSE